MNSNHICTLSHPVYKQNDYAYNGSRKVELTLGEQDFDFIALRIHRSMRVSNYSIQNNGPLNKLLNTTKILFSYSTFFLSFFFFLAAQISGALVTTLI